MSCSESDFENISDLEVSDLMNPYLEYQYDSELSEISLSSDESEKSFYVYIEPRLNQNIYQNLNENQVKNLTLSEIILLIVYKFKFGDFNEK